VNDTPTSLNSKTMK